MTSLLEEARRTVIARDAGVCMVCQHQYQEIHHRYRRGMGGTTDPAVNTPENLICLCRLHHRHAESFRTEARERTGLCIPSIDLAAVTPVLTWYGWQLPTAGGTWLRVGAAYACRNTTEARQFAAWQGLLPKEDLPR